MGPEFWLAMTTGLVLGGAAGWALRARRAARERDGLAALEREIAALTSLRETETAAHDADSKTQAETLDRLEETIKKVRNQL